MRRLGGILNGGIYRSRHGIILGVCKGVAEYFGVSVFWTRVIALILFLVTGFWPMCAIYFAAALLLKPEPAVPPRVNGEKDFYDSYVYSRKAAVELLKRRYEKLDRRIRRMEHVVTSKEFDWHDRLSNSSR
ncbi:MAG: envelope stress response membrane protein PspC [Deltaproteobacteria bacterium]|nr:envelope stress response membrane protein PspC [Deltaproteobacteria bacterium]